jgi:hypothetical protein
MFSLAALFSRSSWPTAAKIDADLPSYNNALLTGGCNSFTSYSAFSDILFFAGISEAQKTPTDRIKAMFTATEAIFWLVSQHPQLDERISCRCIRVLGSLAKECYMFLTISTDDELARGEWHHKLHQSFRRWQVFLSEYLAICHSIDNQLQPLRYIGCDNITFYKTIQILHQEGCGEIEIFLDRTYTLVLYGDIKEARAGFPIPSDLACSMHEGKRRRRVRRLLNDAGATVPPWPNLEDRRAQASARKSISERVHAWCASHLNQRILYHDISSSVFYEKGSEAARQENIVDLYGCPECEGVVT